MSHTRGCWCRPRSLPSYARATITLASDLHRKLARRAHVMRQRSSIFTFHLSGNQRPLALAVVVRPYSASLSGSYAETPARLLAPQEFSPVFLQ
jgi:hypothetical protein